MFGAYHAFAFLLVVFSVLTVLMSTRLYMQQLLSPHHILIAVVNAVVMYLEWKNCREGWEIVLWHIVLGTAFGSSLPFREEKKAE
jgi:hypothetical protein